MAPEDPSPLLRLPAPRTLARKKREMKFPGPPPRNISQHGGRLRAGLGVVRDHFSEVAAKFPALATAVPYVRLQVAPGAIVTDQELSSLGLVPVYRREDAILAAYSRDRDLRPFQSKLTAYVGETQKVGVLAKLETVKPWTREDRTSARIRGTALDPSKSYVVDLLLLPVDWEHPNREAPQVIERFVRERGGRVVDRALQKTFSALRVKMGGQGLDELLEYRDDIALADFAPTASVLVPTVMSITLDDLPEVAAPDETAPAICVVDSGILEGHPLLASAVVAAKSRAFPPKLGPAIPRAPVDKARHGTQVAGIALYGDVGRCADKKSFIPQLRLINARLLDDNNELDEDRMPFVREIVEHVNDEARVLNLSFGLDPHEGFLSTYAAELDGLTREYGVLFVVSSGNVPLETRFGAGPPLSFPDFFEDNHKVLAPAEALNVLTVGGITSDRDPFPAHSTLKAVSPKRAPSPFMRVGGIKNVVKPELVELAGNAAFDATTRNWIRNNPGLRVPTTSHDFARGRLLGFADGTSCAAPKVAHMAGHIIARYADASTNLVRALLVQSAVAPDGVAGFDPKVVLRLCGFGVPNLDRALYCRANRATLYYEGEIEPNEVKLFEIPVPSGFAQAHGQKTLSVTVAYDPPVSVVHRDRPAGIQLTWDLARGDVPEAKVEQAIAAAAESDADPTPEGTAKKKKTKSVFMPGKLPKRPQQRGTVQKNVFTWSRGDYGDPYRLAVTARAVRPAHATEKQTFAVVVSLECADAEVNVFNLVRARLGAGRVRVRVPAP